MDLQREVERKAAYKVYWEALNNGSLTRHPWCLLCWTECITEGHHQDYSKPLDVVWLCKKCHGFVHRTNAEAVIVNNKLMKLCRRCKEFKSAEEFYKNKLAYDGLHTKCIPCARIIGKETRDRNNNK